MKSIIHLVLSFFSFFVAFDLHSATRYVNASNPTPALPYLSWSTAAKNIQDAVDFANPGDLVLVTNGVYASGGRLQTSHGSLVNRVAIQQAITVQSINGAGVTIIQGGATTRCAYITNGAVLMGFTLTNGATKWDAGFDDSNAGGVWGETNAIVSNCVIAGNGAEYSGGAYGTTLLNCSISNNNAAWPGSGGGISSCVASNCIIAGNHAGINGGGADSSTLTACVLTANNCDIWGGGARSCVLNNCILTNNNGQVGGGAVSSSLTNCTLSGNSGSSGGGGNGCTLVNCLLSGNNAGSGGGASGGLLYRCTVSGNTASDGGGAQGASLNSCSVFQNSASTGGGVSGCAVTNSTITGNIATSQGGGAYAGTLTNTIIYYNASPVGPNYSAATLDYCCTTPLPSPAGHNLSAEPLLADFSHLSSISPCRAVGHPASTTGTDIDAETWLNPPSIGGDEYRAGFITGGLSPAIVASFTNVATGFVVNLTGSVAGHANASRWDFGDGTVISNRPYATHAWASAGNYTVTFTAYNESNPGGVSTTVTVFVLTQPIHYVSQSSTNPVAPYLSWATAAADIQSAADAAFAGGSVLVSNGLYQTGGRVVYGSLTNRIVINRPVAVRSVNGSSVTVIQGNPTNSDMAVRCVYLTNGASLTGFTLTQGATRTDGDVTREQNGGGLWCESTNCVVSNCVFTANLGNSGAGGAWGGLLLNCQLSSNSVAGNGGGAGSSFLSNCTLFANSALGGGGAADSSTLVACTLSSNFASAGGGANAGTLVDCLLRGNSVDNAGGGAISSTLTHCLIDSNSATNSGGGVYASTLDRCTISHNTSVDGAGAYASVIVNSALTSNVGAGSGGGANASTLTNCTITGNSAALGGGVHSSPLNNCIVYFNHASRHDNYSGSISMSYCCTTPLIPALLNGTNNIGADPQLASPSHLSAGSPCRGAGSVDYVSGADVDGEAWFNPPAMGCDEFHAGAAGLLTFSIDASATNVAAGFAVDLAASITGNADSSRWEFGDGTIASNAPYVSHSWTAPGDYAVVLRAYNATYPSGISVTNSIHVIAPPIHYVALNNPNPVAPFTSWATAATNIQDAVDAASISGALVLVSNGVYNTGGRVVYGALTNRLAISRPVTVQSVNGAAATIIQGNPTNDDTAVRCVYLTNHAALIGFTLDSGATRADGDSDHERSGGAAWCESSSPVLSNCVLSASLANISAGGVMGGTLFGCTLLTNYAGGDGAGAESAILNRCTLSGNYGPDWWGGGGGGAYFCQMTNCSLLGNSGFYGGGATASFLSGCTLSGNSTPINGGGADSSYLAQCTVVSNSAWAGGGVNSSVLDRCVVYGNTANFSGGASSCSARSSVIAFNHAKFNTGGADSSALTNCTVIGNSAAGSVGGVISSVLANSIVYFNTAPTSSNHLTTTFNYCCTAPMPTNGIGNITSDPSLADFIHLSVASPCRLAGDSASSSGLDCDGEPWANPPSIGADQFISGSSTGSLSVAISAPFTNVIQSTSLDFIGLIAGRANASRWEFGDGTIVSNQPIASHGWTALGVYDVVLRAYNDTYPSGLAYTVSVHVVSQPILYVSLAATNPVSPFTSWSIAATNIQDAVDAANTAGALVLVTNGVYTNGVRWVNNDVPHRVVLDKPITVRSVNGPAFTAIQGGPYAGNYNAIRCAYVGSRATLLDITLTNGAAMPPWAETFDENRSGGGVWCESPSALVSNCVIVACSAGLYAGGSYGGTIKDSVYLNDSSSYGGGAWLGILDGCRFFTNSASWYGYGYGGGAANSVLNNCLFAGNSADNGAGAGGSALNRCVLTGNYAVNGGAVYQCSATNSAITGNSAVGGGGGAYSCLLYNCTVTANIATNDSGGVADSTNFNSLVFYNFAPSSSNWTGGTFDHCDTLPLPVGPGNIGVEPQLADAFHLSAGSPCRGAGLSAYASGSDIDGDAWLNPPSIGADEFASASATGALSVSIQVDYTNAAAGFGLNFAALINGHAAASSWDFGDGTIASNRLFITHSWSSAGTFPVVLRAYNTDNPGGISATTIVQIILNPIHYVALDSTNPVAPYLSWATAATNIQDAVDAAYVGSQVLASNGTYQIGARLVSGESNRVAVLKPVLVRSVNGSNVTIVDGGYTMRCIYLGNGASLAGFTVSHGGVSSYGGGVLCASRSIVVSNCSLTVNGAGLGGAFSGGTLSDSLVANNTGNSGGGGAYAATLVNCDIKSCNAPTGGGAYSCLLSNCLVRLNTAPTGAGAYDCDIFTSTIGTNQASRIGGGAAESRIRDSSINRNTAGQGGGTFECTLTNCVLNTNGARIGGGMSLGVADHCTIISNTATAVGGQGGQGGGADAATLVGCSLIGNLAQYLGGGANGSDLTRCTLKNNRGLGVGGGTFGGTANNSLYTGNYGGNAGGAYQGVLNNCTLVGNSADVYSGGGASSSTLNNCIIYNNTSFGADNYVVCTLNYCCTTPLPDGPGNITNAPLFLNQAGGDFHLQSSSPCINSGNNTYVTNSTDLDGSARITAGTVDIGAYEFQTSAFAAWLVQYGLPADGSADYADPDGDHLNNWQEWLAGTNPTNAASVLKFTSILRGGSGVTLTWQSVTNRTYFLQRASTLSPPAFLPLATNIAGLPNSSSYTDTNATGPGPFFYRVGVQDASNRAQTPFSIISYAWLQQYGFPTDGSADFADPDHDGANNWQEWRAGTDPLDSLSQLRLFAPVSVEGGVTVSWASVTNRTYMLERSPTLIPQTFTPVAANIIGQPGTTSCTDTNATGPGPFFYRVRLAD